MSIALNVVLLDDGDILHNKTNKVIVGDQYGSSMAKMSLMQTAP